MRYPREDVLNAVRQLTSWSGVRLRSLLVKLISARSRH